jgi:uncharacterized protein (UPF0548 family)
MQIRFMLTRRRPSLANWDTRPFAGGRGAEPQGNERRAALERIIAKESPGPPEKDGPFRRASAAIMRYDIFPRRLVTGVLQREAVEVGDTVGTCYHFLPGIDLFFASRVIACFDAGVNGTWRCGFTYRTLAGHPVIGAESFSVEKDMATGRIIVALRSWSRPGILLAHLTRPLMRWLQCRAGRAALDHLQSIATAHASAYRSSSWP